MSNFRRGAEGAAVKVNNQAAFDTTGWFKLGDQESAVIRPLMEASDWPTAEYHSFVPVQKDKPESRKSWPKVLSAVCRKTKGGDGEYIHKDCYICDKPVVDEKGKAISRQTRTFFAAVLREKDENGNWVDKKKTVAELGDDGKPTGNTKQVPDIVYVVQSHRNFIGKMEGYAEVYGTILDRDYYIKRIGNDQTTEYTITPMDKDPEGDLRKPENAARYGITIKDGVFHYPAKWDTFHLLDTQSSDEYYGMYFDPSKPQIDRAGNVVSEGEDTSNDAPAPANEDSMTDLRSRIESYAANANNAPDFGD